MAKVIMLLASVLIGAYIDRKLKTTLNTNKMPKTIIPLIMINLIILTADVSPLIAIKLMLLVQIMLYASYYDMTTKTVERNIHKLIMCIGIIGITPTYLFSESLPGLFLLPIPFLVATMLVKKITGKKSIGNGDIYYIGAMGFALGLTGGCIGIIICLFITLLSIPFIRLNKREKIAFIPNLSLGYIMTILIFVN